MICYRHLTGWLLAAGLSLSGPAHAGLIDRGNGMIYDTDLNITWLADADYARTSGFASDGRMDWITANAWADGLVYSGYDDWRLPSTLWPDATCIDHESFPEWKENCTGSELGHLFYMELGGEVGSGLNPLNNNNYTLFTHILGFSGNVFWSSTRGDEGLAWTFNYHNGFQTQDTQSRLLRPWAVRTGDVAAVPILGSLPLLVVGAAPMLWHLGGRRRAR